MVTQGQNKSFPPESAEALQRFLLSVAPAKEAEFYLKLFREQSNGCFAVIAVQKGVAKDALEAVALDLKALALLGLYPVVLMGLDCTFDVAQRRARRLEDMLRKEDVAARFCGDALSLAPGMLAKNELPLLALGGGKKAEDDVILFLRRHRAQKMVFLHRRGALRCDGERVSALRIDEIETLLQKGSLSQEQERMLWLSQRVFSDNSDARFLVAITSPLELLRELFSIKGAGTLLRRGSVVHSYASLNALDRQRLNEIIEQSFGKALKPNYWDTFSGQIFLEENYRGLALLRPTEHGLYLDKFAVTKDARGEGLGGDLWTALCDVHPSFFWRARHGNPILPWYQNHCDGMQRFEDWFVFWRGLSLEMIPKLATFVGQRQTDFVR